MIKKFEIIPAAAADLEGGTRHKKRGHSVRVWLTKAEKDELTAKAIETGLGNASEYFRFLAGYLPDGRINNAENLRKKS